MRKIVKKAIYTFVFLLLISSTAVLVYLHFFGSEGSNLSGEWTAQIDMSGQAAVTALAWLQDIEGISVSLEDMESDMHGLTVEVKLTMEETDRSEGTFYCSILADSYDTCSQAAYEAFAGRFRELLGERLCMAGYGGSTDQEDVEALVTENLGMSTVSYLMTCGPALLPSLEELQVQYEGSGTYGIANGILTRRFEDGGTVFTKKERCMLEGDTFILLGEEMSEDSGIFVDRHPVIYTRVLDQP